MTEAPALPAGDMPPSIAEMAERLVQLVPADQRSEASQFLTQRILPDRLRSIADHPKPRRLAEVVYQELAERLLAVPAADRLEVLRQEAYRSDVREAASRSLKLAIARYTRDHPSAREAAKSWLKEASAHYLLMSAEELVSEASSGLDRLESLISDLRALDPEFWDTQRVTLLHAKQNFQSARSGSFETAGGSLRDFLMEVGASPDDFAIH